MPADATEDAPYLTYTKEKSKEILLFAKEILKWIKKRIKYIKKLKEVKKRMSEDIEINKFILFGSRAIGKYKRYSDFDIIIISKNFKEMNKLDRPYKLYKKWNLNYPVDFLCYTPEEFNKLKKQTTIVRQAIKEGIEI